MLKSMRKSKNRYFYHIFVSPGNAPRAITLNVVWIEREFDAYKLSRCMCVTFCDSTLNTANLCPAVSVVNFLLIYCDVFVCLVWNSGPF